MCAEEYRSWWAVPPAYTCTTSLKLYHQLSICCLLLQNSPFSTWSAVVNWTPEAFILSSEHIEFPVSTLSTVSSGLSLEGTENTPQEERAFSSWFWLRCSCSRYTGQHCCFYVHIAPGPGGEDLPPGGWQVPARNGPIPGSRCESLLLVD